MAAFATVCSMRYCGSTLPSQTPEYFAEPAPRFTTRLKSVSRTRDKDRDANSVARRRARSVRNGTDRDAFGIEETIRASIDSVKGDEITEVERGTSPGQQ